MCCSDVYLHHTLLKMFQVGKDPKKTLNFANFVVFFFPKLLETAHVICSSLSDRFVAKSTDNGREQRDDH